MNVNKHVVQAFSMKHVCYVENCLSCYNQNGEQNQSACR